MSKGVGIDIIEIERIKQGIEEYKEHFLDRLFSAQEKAYCKKYKDPFPRYAGRFAAKEAIAKAFGVGFGKDLSFQDIEILQDERGKPIAKFSVEIMGRFESPVMEISISHSEKYAVAVAIWID